MFERFSGSARQAVARARELTRQDHAAEIAARHLLAALCEDPAVAALLTGVGIDPPALAGRLRDDLDAAALGSLGIDLGLIRERAEATFGANALDRARSGPADPPFARDAKKLLQVGLREAIRLGDTEIRTEHLLIGSLRLDGSPAQRILLQALAQGGSTPAELRALPLP